MEQSHSRVMTIWQLTRSQNTLEFWIEASLSVSKINMLLCESGQDVRCIQIKLSFDSFCTSVVYILRYFVICITARVISFLRIIQRKEPLTIGDCGRILCLCRCRPLCCLAHRCGISKGAVGASIKYIRKNPHHKPNRHFKPCTSSVKKSEYWIQTFMFLILHKWNMCSIKIIPNIYKQIGVYENATNREQRNKWAVETCRRKERW